MSEEWERELVDAFAHKRAKEEAWDRDWADWVTRAGLDARVASVMRPLLGTRVDARRLPLIRDMVREAVDGGARAVGVPPPHIVEATLDEAGSVTVAFHRSDPPDDHDRARLARRREEREAQEADEAAFNDRCDRAAWAVGLTRDVWIRQVLEAKLGGG